MVHWTERLPPVALEAAAIRRELEREGRLPPGGPWVALDLVSPGQAARLGRAARVPTASSTASHATASPIRLHAVRRVLARGREDSGVPLERVRDPMDHSQLRVTEHYAHALQESLLRDMDGIDEALASAGRGDGEEGTGTDNSGPTRVGVGYGEKSALRRQAKKPAKSRYPPRDSNPEPTG